MQKNFSLLALNTFQVDVSAEWFLEIRTEYDLKEVIEFRKTGQKVFILGEGANTLFVEDFKGLVAHNLLKGREILEETEGFVKMRVCSGEVWMEFVEFCVDNNWSGVENLAYIPGTVGAAVGQNIAAYGQNIEDVVLEVYGIDLESGETFHFSKEECQFAYRDSFFRREENKNLFITSVDLQLSKRSVGVTNYYSRRESLAEELKGKQPPYSVKDIYDAVVSLRKKKLPDWKKVGTAGSFFKNPIVAVSKFNELKKRVKELQSYPVEKLKYVGEEELEREEQVKVPAGRLLEELGWKGKKHGKVGTFENTALVVVNLGGASGREILEFTRQMAEDVERAYQIKLIPEVLVVDSDS